MADQFNRCEKFTLNEIDLSDKVLSIPTPTQMVESRDVTVANAKGRQRGGYLRNDRFSVVLRQDFADGSTHQTIQGAIGSVVQVRFQYLPTSGDGGVATSAANPIWELDVFIAEYTPGSGQTGDVHRVSCNWEVHNTIETLTAEPSGADVKGWPG